MASYLTNPKETFVGTKLYTPNFEAISTILATKQAQYNQGFNQFKSIQDLVSKSKITNTELSKDRDVYLQTAQRELTNLPSLDLSLPENQAKANSVFEPFLSDTNIQRDIIATKKQDREELNFSSFNPDEDSLEYADSRNLGLMNIQREKLRNATKEQLTKNPELFRTVDFVPFTDLNKLMDKTVKDTGFAVELVNSDNDGVMYKTKNGPNSIGNYTAFINSSLSERYNKQFEISARYEYESGLMNAKKILATSRGIDNPSLISDDDAKNAYLSSRANLYKQTFQTTLDSLQKRLKEIEVRKEQLDNLSQPEEKDRMEALQLKQEYDRINSKDVVEYAAQVRKYTPGTKEYQEEMSNMSKDVVSNLARFHRSNTINSLATKYAANVRQDKSVSPEWEIMFKTSKEKFDEQLASERLKIEQTRVANETTELNAKIQGGMFTKTNNNNPSDPSNPSSSSKPGVPSTAETSLTFLGADTENTVQRTPIEIFNEKQNNLKQTAITSLLDVGSGLKYLQDKLKIYLPDDLKGKELEAVTLLNTVGQGKVKYSNLDKTQQRLYQNTVGLLGIKQGTATTGDGGLTLSKAVEDYYTKELESVKDDPIKSAALLSSSFDAWRVSKEAREEYSRNVLAKQKLDDELLKDKTLQNSPYVITDATTGKKRLVTPDDLASQLPSSISDNTLRITNKELAALITKGKVEAGTYIDKDGDFTGYVKIGDKTMIVDIDDARKIMGVNNTYGSEKAITIIKKVSDVVPNVEKYKDGAAGTTFGLTINTDSKIKNEYPVRLIKEATNTGNFNAIYEKTSASNKLLGSDDAAKVELLKILGSDETLLQKYTSGHKISISPNGDEVKLSFKINPDISADTLKNLGITTSTDVTNKTYEIILNPGNKAPEISALVAKAKASNTFIWDKVTRGETVYSTEYENNAGFKYAVIPDGNNNVNVSISKLMYDPTDPNKKPEFVDEPTVLVSLGTKTIDEVRNIINASRDRHIRAFTEATRSIADYKKRTATPEHKQYQTDIKNIKLKP